MSNKNIWIYKGCLTVGSNEQGKTVPLAEGVFVVKFLNKDNIMTEYTAQDLLRDANKIQELQDLGVEMKLNLDSNNNLVYITVESYGSDVSMLDFKNVPILYQKKVLAEKDNTMLQKIKEALVKYKPLDESLSVKGFHNNMVQLYYYLAESKSNKLRVDLNATTLKMIPPMQIKQISDLAKSAQDDKVVVKVQLQSLKMQKETDPVFFRLSSYDTLRRSDMGELLNLAYVNPKQFFEGNDTTLTASVAWEQNLKVTNTNLPREYVLGYDENNDLPIQENEKDFYEYLKQLIREGIKVEQNCKTEEEIDEKISQGISSKIVNEYLLDNCKVALAYNWSHTGSIRNDFEDLIENDLDEDGNEVETQEDLGVSFFGYKRIIPNNEQSARQYFPEFSYAAIKKYFSMNTDKDIARGFNRFLNVPFTKADLDSPLYNEKLRRDLVAVLTTYLENTNNSYKYAEALIKLLRWGQRKPSMLQLDGCEENGVQRYLNFNDVLIQNAKLKFEDLQPDLAEDGSDKFVKGILYLHGDLADKGYMISKSAQNPIYTTHLSVPIGVVYEKSFDNHKVRQVFFSDIYAFMDSVKVEGGFQGVSFKNGNFEVTEKTNSDSMEVYDLSADILNTRVSGIVIDENYKLIEELNTQNINANFSCKLNLISIWYKCFTSRALADDFEKGNPVIDGEFRPDWISRKIASREITVPVEAYEWKIANDYFIKPFQAKQNLNNEVGTDCDTYFLNEVLVAYTSITDEVKPVKSAGASSLLDRLETIQQETNLFTQPKVLAALDKKVISYDITSPDDLYKFIINTRDGKKVKVGFLHQSKKTKLTTFYAMDEFEFRKETFPQMPTGISMAKFEQLIQPYVNGTTNKIVMYTENTLSKIRD